MSVDRASTGEYKLWSLAALTLLSVVQALSLRQARVRPGPMFLASTAVVMTELVKHVVCLFIAYSQSPLQTLRAWKADILKLSLVSFIYTVQNNLSYVAASHLEVPTYQVTYQLKILTTAVFAGLMLNRRLSLQQWVALVLLVIGIAMVQVSGSSEPISSDLQQRPNRFIGFTAAVTECFLSGFAGIYFEKILKGSDISVWMRNVQLSLLSLPFGLATCIISDWSALVQDGWFYGYDGFVIYLIFLQASAGMIVSLVMKYADNILKCYATSLAVVISCLASVYLFNFSITCMFTLGSLLVIISTFIYNQPEKSVIIVKISEEV